MNMPFKTIAVTLLMLTGLVTAADATEHNDLALVAHFQHLAFENKANRYTDYARLFNLCQQKPKAEQCGNKYRNAEQTYLSAKARSDVLGLLVKADNYHAPLPGTAHVDLAKALNKIGYLAEANQYSEKQLLDAVNSWNQHNNFEPSDRLLLIQLVMIQIDAENRSGDA